MAGFWDDYLARKRKQEEEEEERKRTAEAETEEDGEGGSLSFWAGYQRQKRTGESAPVPVEEEESLSLTDRLAQRGIAVDPVARHGTSAQGQTAAPADTSRTLAALTGNGKTGANLFTDRIGNTFTAARAQRDKLAAQAEEERKDQTVRNQDWLDALRTPEEIQAELDEENAKVKEYDRQAFKNNALGVWRDLIGQNAKTDAENQRISAERKAHDERKAALEDELAEAQWAGYERLRNNADFEAKSQYKSTANGQETKKNPNGGYDSVGFDDVEYEYVNGNQDAATILANESREAGEANGILGVFVKPKEYEYTQLGEMSDEEKSLYNYIHATKGKQAAHEYLEYLRSDLYARQAEKEKNEAAVYAEEHPVLSTVRTVGTSPLRGVGYLGQAAQYLTEGTVDANAPYNRFSYLTSAERETVTRTVERNWGKAGSFAYGVGVSMAEFLLNSGISGGNEALSLALMGAGAASDATIEAKERGLADWQSFALGTIAGAAEIITEKVSIEKLFSDPGGRPWKYLLQNILAEGSEEAASDVINLVADVLITQDKSEWMKSVREYQKDNPGMSEDEAFVQVMKDQGLQILYDAAAGAASGGIMALPGSLRAFAQLSQDRSQRIEAGRQAIQAKRIQAQESGGGIVLPTADNTSETGDVIRTGAESDSTNPLRTVDEAEVDERVAKARNITEATGIRYGVDQKEIRRAERLGRMTGQEVEFYSHEAENGVVENGHMDPVTGKIWLNAKGKNPLQVTLGHEFTHSLEGTDAYRDLVDLAKTQTAESGGDWAAKADRYARLYEAHGDRVSDEMLDQELTADFVGETLFTDERAIREMFRENPSLGKQVRDAIDNFIVRASDMGGIMSPVDEQKFKNVLKIYDRYVRAAEVDRRSTPEVPAKREASMDRDETAQEAREDAQAVDAVQEGNRQAEVPIAQETTRAAQLRARPWRTGKQTAGEQILSGNDQAAQGNAQQAETVSGMIVPESGEESPAEYRARMDALYDAGEITGEEYDEAMALADEAESTGRGFSSSTVERDEGPRGKFAEIADRLRGRYSLSEEEQQDRGDPDIRRSLSEDSTSIISRPLSEYPIEKQKQIQQYIDAVDDSVLKFVNETRQKKKRYPFSIVTGIVSDELASRIRDITGVDMTGKEVRLRRNSIEHVDNRHTSKKADVKNIADQMMEDPRDIARAQYVLDNFDNVEKGKWRSLDIMNSDNTGAQTVVVSKKIDGTYYVIEAVPDAKDKRLEIVSAHIKGDGSVADANAPSPTSITTVPQSPESSISDSGTDVNGGEKRFSLSPEKRIGEGPGDDTDSWYFKNWFGDYVNDPENASKVVNPDGTPKRMYHGTNADKEFTMFDTYGANYGLYGAGSYFTDNPEVAQSYTSKGRGKNPRVYEVYLNIRNPIVMEEEADVDRWLDALPELADYITVPGDSELAAVTNRDFYRAMEEYLADQGLTKWEAAEDAMDTLKAMGYDGINHVGGLARGDVQHDVWIAFDPEQIKSATDNIGTYDPNDPDIRYSLTEEQGTQDELAGLSQRVKSAVMRVEKQLTDNVLQGIQRKLNPNSAEYRQFRSEVARPVIESILRGEAADPDAVLESAGIDILGQAAARGAVNDALRQASGELGRIRTAVQQSNARQQARDARKAELEAQLPDNTDGLKRLANQVKDAKKRWDGIRARTVMQEEDLDIAHQIAIGQMSEEEARARYQYGIEDIVAMAEAEREYLDHNELWEYYKRKLESARREENGKLLENVGNAKDKINGLAYATETAERNFRDVFGRDAAAMIDHLIRPVHISEAESTRFKNRYINRVKSLDLSQKVRRGNANSEAAAVQFLGEAEDNVRVLQAARRYNAVRDGKTLEEWKAEIEAFRTANPNLDYDKVHRAIEEFQQIYKELIDLMNDVLVRNGYMPVNVRRGYFPHFQSGNDSVIATFAHALNINIQNNALPTSINGLTSNFKPGKPWFGHAMERTGFNTKYDAVAGFEGYIGGVSDVIHQTTNIRNLRSFFSQIRETVGGEELKKRIQAISEDTTLTESEKQAAIDDANKRYPYLLSKFVAWGDEYTNLLANKKSRYDRAMEDLFGRGIYTVVKNLEGRVAANMISGNAGSALTNFIPLNQAASILGERNLLRGIYATLTRNIRGDDLAQRSDFLTNRRGTDKLTMSWTDKLSDKLKLNWLMDKVDGFTSEAVVRTAYERYIRDGMDEETALQMADETAAGIMADRSKGALPTIFASHNPLFKAFTQFQVEVNNEFRTVFKDIPKGVYLPDKDKKRLSEMAGAILIRYFLGAMLFNDLYEKVVGRRAALDPLDLLNDLIGDLTGKKLNNAWDAIRGRGILDTVWEDEEDKPNTYKVTENFVTGLGEEMPFVGGAVFGGGRIPAGSAIPNIQKLNQAAFDNDWDKDKKTEAAIREIGGTAGAYLLPPMAGGLIKKGVQTTTNLLGGGRTIKDKEGKDQMQYPFYTEASDEDRERIEKLFGKVGLDEYADQASDIWGTAQELGSSLLFGPTSTEGGREWVESGFGKQTAKNTALYRTLTQDLGENQRATWDMISGMSGNDSQKKRMTIATSGLSEEGKALAMETVMNSGQSVEGTKFRAAYENGVSADAWAYFYDVLPDYDADENNSYKQAEVQAALDNARIPLSSGEGAAQGLFGGAMESRSLTRQEKAAIWAAYNLTWKAEKNPYDPAIGERVRDIINRLKGGNDE